MFQRQRLYVGHRKGTLYVAEAKHFSRLIKIDPDSAACTTIDLPMYTEDLAMDADGHAYLRMDGVIGRFEMDSWREVPYDYGEEYIMSVNSKNQSSNNNCF